MLLYALATACAAASHCSGCLKITKKAFTIVLNMLAPIVHAGIPPFVVLSHFLFIYVGLMLCKNTYNVRERIFPLPCSDLLPFVRKL